MPTLRLNTPERVREVIGNPDPVSRNLQITQSYHELAAALRKLYKGPDVPWCSFAVWASKQAGTFIRKEEVPAPLRRFLAAPGRLPGRHALLEFARMTVDDVAVHVAEGNRLVYTKLAPIFADFLIFARQQREPDPERLDAFLEKISREPESGEKLQRAFRHYHEAFFETDAETRAELIFLANALVGWHEQIRLQEAIEGALDAPIRRALEDPERRLSRLPLPAFLRRATASLFLRLWRPKILSFEDEWKRIATECVLSLGEPDGGRLELGEDLPPLEDGSLFPSPLRRISHPEGAELLAALDRTADALDGSAASDWSRLSDRMNYIVDYFRSRQQSRDLLRPPYEASQVHVIRLGRRPSGPL